MEDNIRVIIKEPGEDVKDIVIKNELTNIQHILGGYLEYINLGYNLCMLINEEGRLKYLKPNIEVYDMNIVGTVLFSKYDDEGELISLTDNDVECIMNLLKYKII